MWPDGAKYTGSYVSPLHWDAARTACATQLSFRACEVHGNKSGLGLFAWADGSSYQVRTQRKLHM